MNYIQWPWDTIMVNDGMRHGALVSSNLNPNSELGTYYAQYFWCGPQQRNPDSNLGYQRTSRSDIETPRSSALQTSPSSYHATGGTGIIRPVCEFQDSNSIINEITFWIGYRGIPRSND
jgi:hypothetical protein